MWAKFNDILLRYDFIATLRSKWRCFHFWRSSRAPSSRQQRSWSSTAINGRLLSRSFHQQCRYIIALSFARYSLSRNYKQPTESQPMVVGTLDRWPSYHLADDDHHESKLSRAPPQMKDFRCCRHHHVRLTHFSHSLFPLPTSHNDESYFLHPPSTHPVCALNSANSCTDVTWPIPRVRFPSPLVRSSYFVFQTKIMPRWAYTSGFESNIVCLSPRFTGSKLSVCPFRVA